MKTKKLRADERGIAHLGLLLVVLVFVAVGALVYWRFSTANKPDQVSQNSSSQQVQNLDELENNIEGASTNADSEDEGADKATSEADKAIAEEGGQDNAAIEN